jgi:hypothetical protein
MYVLFGLFGGAYDTDSDFIGVYPTRAAAQQDADAHADHWLYDRYLIQPTVVGQGTWED